MSSLNRAQKLTRFLAAPVFESRLWKFPRVSRAAVAALISESVK